MIRSATSNREHASPLNNAPEWVFFEVAWDARIQSNTLQISPEGLSLIAGID
jgi:hypothetical protein